MDFIGFALGVKVRIIVWDRVGVGVGGGVEVGVRGGDRVWARVRVRV